jgi:hypothetical protein
MSMRLALEGQAAGVVLAICAPVYAAAYLGALLLLKVPNGEETKLAQRQWTRLRRRLRPAVT